MVASKAPMMRRNRILTFMTLLLHCISVVRMIIITPEQREETIFGWPRTIDLQVLRVQPGNSTQEDVAEEDRDGIGVWGSRREKKSASPLQTPKVYCSTTQKSGCSSGMPSKCSSILDLIQPEKICPSQSFKPEPKATSESRWQPPSSS